MKLLLTAALGASFMYSPPAKAQAMIEAKTTTEAAAVIRDADTGQSDLIRDAIGLGVADPIELVFALISPETPEDLSERIAHALTLAAPRRADEVAVSTAIAADIVSEEARLIDLIETLLSALAAIPLTHADREEETREVLAALLSVADPDLQAALADAVAGGDGAALLAVLGDGPETAAINVPPRPFGETPLGLIPTPGNAAQDAPSAN